MKFCARGTRASPAQAGICQVMPQHRDRNGKEAGRGGHSAFVGSSYGAPGTPSFWDHSRKQVGCAPELSYQERKLREASKGS